ncbi:MAG: hypothetical protein UGF43_01670 [Blautia sp.]|nr:hypothetical protein [Blautia sp.]
MDTSSLMEQILSSDNLNRAYLQVVRNKGAEGININETDITGFGSLAQAKYNPHTDEHTLRVCSNFEVIKYVVFHEFTHILDAEMYAKNNPANYAYLSGYTEYHASQIELLILLGIDNMHSLQQSTFSMDTRIAAFPNKMSVDEYLHGKHRFVIDMMHRDDFPKDLEVLKTTIGVLYNYLGIRSICKMYGKDYRERKDNTSIIKWTAHRLIITPTTSRAVTIGSS